MQHSQTLSSCWHCDTEMLEPTWHTGGCDNVTLTQGTPTGKGQPQHKLHFQGCLHAWLHQVQRAQQGLSQKLLNCCILLFNKPCPNWCNYLFTCLLTPLTSPRMSSHLSTAHPSSGLHIGKQALPKKSIRDVSPRSQSLSH